MFKKFMVVSIIVSALLITMTLSVAASSPAAGEAPIAQSTEAPTPVPGGDGGSGGYQHPVVRLLDAYFGPIFNAQDDGTEPGGTQPGETQPGETQPDSTQPGDEEPASVGDQIAQLHEDGMGFGVIVKLYAIAAESKEACIGQGVDCAVDVNTLVEEFKSGTGMGKIMQEYGKPSMLGVGHVRQALKGQEVQQSTVETGKPGNDKVEKEDNPDKNQDKDNGKNNEDPGKSGEDHGNGNGNGGGKGKK